MKEKIYTIIPEDWDYDCPELERFLKIYAKRGIYTPCQIEYLVDLCGAFTEKQVGHSIDTIIAFWEDFKANKWPIIKFALYEGETWGSLKLIKEI